MLFFLMIRRPTRSTRTDTLFPYTTLFRSDLVTIFPEVVSQIVAFSLRPDESKPGGIDVRREEGSFLDTVAAALKLPALRVVETGGNSFAAEREQWDDGRSEEHTSELQSLMRISYAVFCLKKKHYSTEHTITTH